MGWAKRAGPPGLKNNGTVKTVPSFVVRDMAEDILYAAAQNITQVIQGGGGDIPPLLEGIQGPLAEGILFNEGICADAFFLHGRPQRLIRDHRNHRPFPDFYDNKRFCC